MAKEGRPTKYSDQILKDTQKYLDLCVDSYQRVLLSKKKKSVTYKHDFVIKVPTIEGLAKYLHIHKDTVHDWKKKHAEFSDLIGDLLAEQADRLINNGLNGTYNPTIAKVLLTKHGYREGHEVANPDGSNVFRPSDADKKAAETALKDM